MALAILRVTMLIVMIAAIMAMLSIAIMATSMVNTIGMLMVMVLVDGTCHCKGGNSDHDDGRDMGEGELLTLVNMRVKMMVMMVVIIISMSVALTVMMKFVKFCRF